MNRGNAFDVVVIGAGPAGLGAARTAARLGFSTLVLERLATAGELSHPCSAIIAPVPHASLRQKSNLKGVQRSVYFRKVDLSIPAGLIRGYPTLQHWISPSGHDFTATLSGQRNSPAAVVDKAGLLRHLAGQAQAAGAELRFARAVAGLLRTDGRVTGVLAEGGEGIRAGIVLSAEGATRRLCSQALPGAGLDVPRGYVFVANQEFEAPAVGPAQIGQIITFGRRTVSARDAFGMAVTAAPGHLSVFSFLLGDGPNCYTEPSASFHMQEYLLGDPRVSQLCAGARPVGPFGFTRIAVTSPARHVVADGFMGLGDAIAPAGHLGILPSLYLGRQAALIAGEALEAGDTSARRLLLYERIFCQHFLPDLSAEAENLLNLSQMTDPEVEALCKSAGFGEGLAGRAFRSLAPFAGHARSLEWETVGSQGNTPVLPTAEGLQPAHAFRWAPDSAYALGQPASRRALSVVG